MNREKLIQYHLSRLNDKRREIRLEAIQELQLLEASEALEALQRLFEQDDDEDVKKAAQNAGRAIFKANKQKT